MAKWLVVMVERCTFAAAALGLSHLSAFTAGHFWFRPKVTKSHCSCLGPALYGRGSLAPVPLRGPASNAPSWGGRLNRLHAGSPPTRHLHSASANRRDWRRLCHLGSKIKINGNSNNRSNGFWLVCRAGHLETESDPLLQRKGDSNPTPLRRMYTAQPSQQALGH